MQNSEQIIIFDGICGLCNKSVDILIKLDSQKQFKYTSLQGEFIKTLEIDPDIDSIIFYDDNTLYYKSNAILKIFNALGGVWKLTNIFYVIPRVIRDYIYDVIAKYRYKIFGKILNCRVPTKDEEVLFID